jgi:predicted O-methyltransferase YrrM
MPPDRASHDFEIPMNPSEPSRQLPEALRGNPWRNHKAMMPDLPPTMLAREELQLLHWLTSRSYTGEGAIVDAGCFLGASTCALASGLADNPSVAKAGKPIHSFDIFNTTTNPPPPTLAEYGLELGQSFLDIYKKNVGTFLERVEIHEGDLLKQSWGGEKIEILFLDCCETAALHDRVVRLWFSSLIPGKSVLIQRGFGWREHSWSNIMMEVFRDHFVVLDDVPLASRVYLCVRAINEEDAARRTYASLSGDERLRYMEDSLKSVTREDFKAQMLVNHAMEASSLGRTELLDKILLSIFATPRADLVAPVVVKNFPERFAGPELLPPPSGLDDPKLCLISQTCPQDRMCIYGLIFATQPKRVLEIGRARGGSTLLIASALRHVPGSTFVSIDPNSMDEHSISPVLERKLSDKVTFIHGFSPQENGRALAAAKGKFDFVFIDGNHYYEACLADIHGVVPYLADDAVILFHDAFFAGVEDAIHDALETEHRLVDCGMVSTVPYHGSAHQSYRGRPQIFGGIRMLRFRPSAALPPASASLQKRLHRLETKIDETRRELAGQGGAGMPKKRSFLKKLKRSIRKRMGKNPD